MNRSDILDRRALTFLTALLVAAPAFGQGTVAPNRGQNASEPAGDRDAGGDRRLTALERTNLNLAAHGVSMAIEAYSLRNAAREAGTGDKADRTNDKGHPDRSAELRQHARRTFEASDRLLGQAARGIGREMADRTNLSDRGTDTFAAKQGNRLTGTAPSRFVTAADEYASTLRRLAPEADKDKDARKGDSQAEEAAEIVILNHAVKEVIATFHVRQNASLLAPSESSRLMIEHSLQMEEDARNVIREMTGEGHPGPNPAVENLPGSVKTLARQAAEIARAAGDFGILFGQGGPEAASESRQKNGPGSTPPPANRPPR